MTAESGQPDTETVRPDIAFRQETEAAGKRRRAAEKLREGRIKTQRRAAVDTAAGSRIKKNKNQNKNAGKRKKTLDVSLFLCYP